MSYLNPLSRDTLPRLQSAEPRSHLVEPLSARRIRALEEELAVYKRLHSAPPGILRHNDYDSGNQTRRAVAEVMCTVFFFKSKKVKHYMLYIYYTLIRRTSNGRRHFKFNSHIKGHKNRVKA